jgi:archaellum biogenesis protein FlaJ (TadC family)
MGYLGILFFFNLLVISGPITLLNSLVISPLQRQAILAGGLNQSLLISTIFQQVLSILLTILYQSLQAIAITLAYFDLRMRLEGFDLAVQTLSPDQSIVEQLSQAPKSPASSKLINWNDVIHFLLLSLIVASLYTVVIMLVMAFGLGTGLGGLH